MLRLRVFFRNDCNRFWGISLGIFTKKINYSTRARWIWESYS